MGEPENNWQCEATENFSRATKGRLERGDDVETSGLPPKADKIAFSCSGESCC